MPKTKSTRGGKEGKAPEPTPEKKVNLGCSRTPPLPKGLVLKDVRNRVWSLGKSVGSGGFGDIYLCDRKSSSSVGDNAEFVVKVEPHDNGPLFVEMHFFMRVALSSQMAEWDPREGRQLGFVGMPTYQGSGSMMFKGNKYRFLVMDRFGSDLDKFFQGGLNPFPLPTVLNIAVQVIDTLQYIHSRNYAHNDIKAQNLLLGYGRGKQDLVYLVDYGLACKFRDDYGFHHSSAPDARKAHDGTMEYTSRDAHTGAHSRRGDLETLGYNMVHWLSGYLPWMNYLEEPEQVAAQKNGYMGSIKSFLTRCFRPESYPDIMEDYLNYVAQLEFETEPDYDYLRSMLAMALREAGSQLDSKLHLSVPKSKKGKKGKSQKVNIKEREDSRRGGTPDIPEFAVEELRSNTRSRGNDNSKSWNWEEVLCGNPEDILRASSNPDEEEDQNEKEAANLERQAKALLNPTPEMKKILDERKAAEAAREGMSWKEQLTLFNQKNALAKARWAEADLTPKYHTPVMEEVMNRRSDRFSIDAAPETPEPSDHNDSDGEVELKVSPKTKNKKTVSGKGKKKAVTKNKKSVLSTKANVHPVSPPVSKPGRSAQRRKVNNAGSRKSNSQPISSPEPISNVPSQKLKSNVPKPNSPSEAIPSEKSKSNVPKQNSPSEAIPSEKPKSNVPKQNSPSEAIPSKKTKAIVASKTKLNTSQRRKSNAPSKSQPSSPVETTTKAVQSKRKKSVSAPTPKCNSQLKSPEALAISSGSTKSKEAFLVSKSNPQPSPVFKNDPIKNKVITSTRPMASPIESITKIVYAKSSRNVSPLTYSTDSSRKTSIPECAPNAIRNILQNSFPTAVTTHHTTTTIPSQISAKLVYAKSSRNLPQPACSKDPRNAENNSLPTYHPKDLTLTRNTLQPASIPTPTRNITLQPASIPTPPKHILQSAYPMTPTSSRNIHQPTCSPNIPSSNRIPQSAYGNLLHPTYPSESLHSRNILSAGNRIISQSSRPLDLMSNRNIIQPSYSSDLTTCKNISQPTYPTDQTISQNLQQSGNPIPTDPINGRNLPPRTFPCDLSSRNIPPPAYPLDPVSTTNIPKPAYPSDLMSGRNILQHTNPMHATMKALPSQPNKIVYATSSRNLSQPAIQPNPTGEAVPSRSANIVYAVSSRSIPQPTYLAERTESAPSFRSTTQIPQPSSTSTMQNTPVPPSFLSSSVPAHVTSLTELDISISSANNVNGLLSHSSLPGEENDTSALNSPPSAKKMGTCSICSKIMYKASMARHYRDVHKLSDEQRKELNRENLVKNRSHLETDDPKSEIIEKIEHQKEYQNISDSAEERLSGMEPANRVIEESLAKIVRDHNLDEPLDEDSMVVTLDPSEDTNLLAMLVPPIEVSTSPTLAAISENVDRLSALVTKDLDEDISVICLSDESRMSPAVMSSTESNLSPMVMEESSSSSLEESSEDANSTPMLVDPLTGELYVDGATECPICGASMLKSVVAKHCADVHNSPVHKTRKRKSNVASVKISISQDSPARIRNKDSPSKTQQDVSPPGKSKRSLIKTVTIAEQVSVEGETETIDLKGSVDDCHSENSSRLSPMNDDDISVVEVLPPESDDSCMLPEIKLVQIPPPEKSLSVSSSSPSFHSATPSPVASDLSPSPILSESTNQTAVVLESRSPSPVSVEKVSPTEELKNKMQEFFVPPSSVSVFPSHPLASKNTNTSLLPASPMFSPSPSPDLERQSGSNSPIIPQESWSALDTGTPTPPLKLTKLHSTSSQRNEVWQVAQKLPTVQPTVEVVPKNRNDSAAVNDNYSNSVMEESYPHGIIEESSNDSELSAISEESNISSKSTSSNEVIINPKSPLTPPPKPIVFAPRHLSPPPPPLKSPEPPKTHTQIEREAHLDALFDQILKSPAKNPNTRPMTNVQELPKDGGLIFQDDVSDTDSYQSDDSDCSEYEPPQYESDEDDIILNVDEGWLNNPKQTGELDEGDEDSAVDISFEGHDDYQDETDGGNGNKSEFSVNYHNNKDNSELVRVLPQTQDIVKKKVKTKKSKESISLENPLKQKKIAKAMSEKSKKPAKKVSTKIQKQQDKKETASKKISKPKMVSPIAEAKKSNTVKKVTSPSSTKKIDQNKLIEDTPKTPKRKRKPSKKVLENEDFSPPNKLIKLSTPIHSELLPVEITVPVSKKRKHSPKSVSPPSKKEKVSKTLNSGKQKIASELADIDDKRTSKSNAKISKVTSSLSKSQVVSKIAKQGKKIEKSVKILTKSSEKVLPKKGEKHKKRTRSAAVSTRSLDLSYHF